jgi:hypothetical protein
MLNEIKEFELRVLNLQKSVEVKEKVEKELSDVRAENLVMKQELETYRSSSRRKSQELSSVKEELGVQIATLKRLENEVKQIPDLQNKLKLVKFAI